MTLGTMLTDRALSFLFILPIFLVSLTVHEYAHGWMAFRYGDDTAKRMGRLTLNPLAHISLIGTIILPLIVHFGWAKPVPVNFLILTKKQIFKVAAAGPIANILLAIILSGCFHVFGLEAATAVGNFVLLAVLLNLILAVFNLLPIPPLDGSKMVYARLKSPEAINRLQQICPVWGVYPYRFFASRRIPIDISCYWIVLYLTWTAFACALSINQRYCNK